MPRYNLLIIGGANVEYSADVDWVTKKPVSDYINELGKIFGRCIWMAKLYEGPRLMKGRICSKNVTVVPLKNGFFERMKSWLCSVAVSLRRPYCILFLPAILYLTPVIPLLCLFSKRTIVYLPGDYEMAIKQLADTKWCGWPFVYRFAHELSMRLCNTVIARGKYLADTARRCNSNVVETIPIAHIEDAAPCPRIENRADDSKHILYLGKLLWSKGIEDLLSALKILLEKHSTDHIVLDIVGDGPERGEMERFVVELCLDDNVEFRGWVEGNDELSFFFAQADVLAVPTSTYPEGVPRVIDEGLMRDVPVVATKVGGIVTEFDNDQIILVNPNSPSELAEAIEAVLYDPKVHQQCLDGARRRQQRWTGCSTAAAQHSLILFKHRSLGNI